MGCGKKGRPLWGGDNLIKLYCEGFVGIMEAG